jgi:hypothetical protein
MRVIIRLIQDWDRNSREAVDSAFDPILFDGHMDNIDPVRAAYDDQQPIELEGRPFDVTAIHYNAVSGETVAEIEVRPRFENV